MSGSGNGPNVLAASAPSCHAVCRGATARWTQHVTCGGREHPVGGSGPLSHPRSPPRVRPRPAGPGTHARVSASSQVQSHDVRALGRFGCAPAPSRRVLMAVHASRDSSRPRAAAVALSSASAELTAACPALQDARRLAAASPVGPSAPTISMKVRSDWSSSSTSPGTTDASRIRANRPGSRASVACRCSIWPVPPGVISVSQISVRAESLTPFGSMSMASWLLSTWAAVARASTNITPTVAANRVRSQPCHPRRGPRLSLVQRPGLPGGRRHRLSSQGPQGYSMVVGHPGRAPRSPTPCVDQTIREVLVVEPGESLTEQAGADPLAPTGERRQVARGRTTIGLSAGPGSP